MTIVKTLVGTISAAAAMAGIYQFGVDSGKKNVRTENLPVELTVQVPNNDITADIKNMQRELDELKRENSQLKQSLSKLPENNKIQNISHDNISISEVDADRDRDSLRNRLIGHYVSVRPIIKNDEYVKASILIGGTVEYELTIPDSGEFFKSKLIGSKKSKVAIVDSKFTPLSTNKFKIKEMERRRIAARETWMTGFTWNGTLKGNQIELTSTDQQNNKYVVTLEKRSGV